MKVVSGKRMRRIEAAVTEKIGLPTLLMMENAAIRLSEHCLAYLKGKVEPRVIILAGVGGNGGDGLALARHLHLKGIDVSIILTGDVSRIHGDALINLQILQKLGLCIRLFPSKDNAINVPWELVSCDLVVDALFGAGLDRHIEGVYEYMIDMVNSHAPYVIAVDMPSGISADTGAVMGTAIKADVTVALGYLKTGLIIYPGAEYAGRVEVADISIPDTPLSDMEGETGILTDHEAAALLPRRPQISNKGTFGRVYAFAGSSNMPGAAFLSAAAAYKAGAGYVCACVIPSVARVLHHSLKEAVTCVLPDCGGYYHPGCLDVVSEELSRADALYAGPGIGRGPRVTEFVFRLIETARIPMVLDADALNAVSEDVDILKKIQVPCVITPHPGEMSRLTGLPVKDILENTIGVAGEFAREFGVVTLLKDARTIVTSPAGCNYINTSGSPAMAKAGSGDVLTGVIAGFMAQGLDPYTAAKLGAYVHGKAGESAGAELSNYGVSASDLLNHISMVLKRCEKLYR
ncbi:MAG: NAD(P)H-hydrate dehydratase [Clostridiales bacterium]|jgi:NAD(P)H-hydrate epimerase|nr:NAD(P)H-hydrate dehydratase [Clostridiales bacterium]